MFKFTNKLYLCAHDIEINKYPIISNTFPRLQSKILFHILIEERQLWSTAVKGNLVTFNKVEDVYKGISKSS